LGFGLFFDNRENWLYIWLPLLAAAVGAVAVFLLCDHDAKGVGELLDIFENDGALKYLEVLKAKIKKLRE
jgi:hypothetical protein